MANGATARTGRRFLPVVLLSPAAVLLLAVGGCAGVHLYDAEGEKLAQGAKKSFETADVKATIAGARENQAALTEAEVAQARRIVEARRNLLLNAIAGDQECEQAQTRAVAATQPASVKPEPPQQPKPALYGRIGSCIDFELKRLVVLSPGTSPDGALDSLRRAVATLEVFSDAMADDRANVQILFKGLDLPQCDPATQLPATPPATLFEEAAKRSPNEPFPALYQFFVGHCKTYQDALRNIVGNATGSDFALAVQEWMDGRIALASARKVVARLRREYEDTLKEYETAAAILEQGDSKEVRDKFGEALKKLKAASEALEKAGGFVGLKAISEERLDQVNAVIAALQGGQLDPKQFDASVRRAVGVVGTLPGFADRALDIARRRHAPPLGPLLLEKGLQQTRLAAANRQVLREEERLIWLERRMTAQRNRAIRLLEGRRALAKIEGRLPATAVEAFSDATPADVRVPLRRSVADYADSFSIEAATVAEAEYRLLSLQYDIALDRSEDAVQQWQSLIAVPIDRLIAYHGAGVKPAEVAAIVTQAIGLAAIGVGVNR